MELDNEKLAQIVGLLKQARDEHAEQLKQAAESAEPQTEEKTAEAIKQAAEAFADKLVEMNMLSEDAEEKTAAVELLSTPEGCYKYIDHAIGLYKKAQEEGGEKKASDDEKPEPRLGQPRDKVATDLKGKPEETGNDRLKQASDTFGDRIIEAASKR